MVQRKKKKQQSLLTQGTSESISPGEGSNQHYCSMFLKWNLIRWVSLEILNMRYSVSNDTSGLKSIFHCSTWELSECKHNNILISQHVHLRQLLKELYRVKLQVPMDFCCSLSGHMRTKHSINSVPITFLSLQNVSHLETKTNSWETEAGNLGTRH